MINSIKHAFLIAILLSAIVGIDNAIGSEWARGEFVEWAINKGL